MKNPARLFSRPGLVILTGIVVIRSLSIRPGVRIRNGQHGRNVHRAFLDESVPLTQSKSSGHMVSFRLYSAPEMSVTSIVCRFLIAAGVSAHFLVAAIPLCLLAMRCQSLVELGEESQQCPGRFQVTFDHRPEHVDQPLGLLIHPLGGNLTS